MVAFGLLSMIPPPEKNSKRGSMEPVTVELVATDLNGRQHQRYKGFLPKVCVNLIEIFVLKAFVN